MKGGVRLNVRVAVNRVLQDSHCAGNGDSKSVALRHIHNESAIVAEAHQHDLFFIPSLQIPLPLSSFSQCLHDHGRHTVIIFNLRHGLPHFLLHQANYSQISKNDLPRSKKGNAVTYLNRDFDPTGGKTSCCFFAQMVLKSTVQRTNLDATTKAKTRFPISSSVTWKGDTPPASVSQGNSLDVQNCHRLVALHCTLNLAYHGFCPMSPIMFRITGQEFANRVVPPTEEK